MQVSVEEMLKPDTEQTVSQGERKNRFFSLVNDGDSAIVRFLHDNASDFEVLDVHNIQLGGYNRKINCLKSINGTKDECALCQNNTYDEDKGTYKYPVQRKFFIHMLKYDNPQSAVEQVWERSKDYIKKLHQLEQDYGPLYSRLYKIVRHGAKGSMDTTYDILPLDKDRFNPDNFVFNMNQLNYEKALGTIVLNKSNEDINEYLKTGNFPDFRGKKEEVTPRPNMENNTSQFNQPQMNTNNSFNSNYTSQQSINNYQNNYEDNSFPFDGPRRRV